MKNWLSSVNSGDEDAFEQIYQFVDNNDDLVLRNRARAIQRNPDRAAILISEWLACDEGNTRYTADTIGVTDAAKPPEIIALIEQRLTVEI